MACRALQGVLALLSGAWKQDKTCLGMEHTELQQLKDALSHAPTTEAAGACCAVRCNEASQW